jgi:hypothetical protein
MKQQSASQSHCFIGCALMLVASFTVTLASASTWRCIDSSDGHSYIVSQSVPSDRCELISEASPYASRRNVSDADSLVGTPARKAKSAAKRAIKRQGASIGMSKDEVLESSWGHPEHINRTTNAYGTREQWVYGGGNYLYFENGVLTSIQN